MGKVISNSEVMQIFRNIDEIKANKKLTPAQAFKQINELQNNIVKELTFLVRSHTKQYKQFPNYEDLVQEGFVGLIKAVRRFDHTRFPNFFVFAEQWIWNNVKRAASRFDVVYNPEKKRVVYVEPASLEEESGFTPEDTFSESERNHKLSEAMSNDLTPREKEVLCGLYGLGEKNVQTLREIGPQFDLTHERIRQIKNEALDKLRKNKQLQEIV